MKRRISALLLALVMTVGLLPRTAWAAEPGHTHVVSEGGEAITWTAWDSADTLPPQDGNYYLTRDVTLSQTWALGTRNIKLDLNGHSVSGTFSDDTHLIEVDATGSLTVTDCQNGVGISARGSTSHCSIFGIYSSGDVTLTGGAKLHVESDLATAVKMKGSGHLTISGDAEISVKTFAVAAAYGVENDNTATATITENAKINAVSAEKTAYGIYNYGTSVVNGSAKITATSNASSNTSYAYGIYHRDGSDGSVSVGGNATVTATDPSNGSYGIYNATGQSGFVAVTDSARVSGSRTGVANKGTLRLCGGPTISGGAEGNDVSLDSGSKIVVTGALTYANPIRVRVVAKGSPFTSGWNTHMSGTTDLSQYFVSAESGYDVVLVSNELQLSQAQPAHSHAVSVGCSTAEGDQVEFTEWNTADVLPTTAGHYALTTDVTLTEEWEAPRNGVTTLCLNGHAIRSNLRISTTHGIKVPGNAILNICDCSEGQAGAIDVTQTYNVITSAICTYGTLNLYGGNVLMTSSYNCSGLELSGNSNIYGGTVLATLTKIASDNYNPKVYGIDTYSSDKNINISGGVFKANCTSSNAGTNEALRCYGLNVSDYNNPNLSVTGGVFIGKAAVSANQASGKQIKIKATGGIYSTDPTGSIDPSYTARKITASDPGYRVDYANYYVLKPTSAQPGHTHAWAAAWSKNDTHHWHECTADGCGVTDNSGKNGYGEHVYDDGRDTTCNTCGYTRTVTPPDPGHTHSWAGAWTTDETHHWHECAAEGCPVTDNSGKDGYGEHVYDNGRDTTCDTCGYTRTATPPDPGHTHSWAGAWTTDETHHWHECAAEGCGVTDNSGKNGYGAHVYDNGRDTTCSTCGYTRQAGYDISGAVTDKDDGPVSGAVVKLMRGRDQIGESVTTDDRGRYSFTGVAPGIYNVVAEKDGVTKTILVEIAGQSAAGQNIQMPDGKTNSVVEVKGENTPAVVVGGVDAVAEAQEATGGQTVTVKLTVEKKDDSAAENAEEIKRAAGGKTLDFLELRLEKTVTDGTSDETTNITDTQGKVLKIVVPYDFTNKKEVTVYRYHGGSAQALTRADTGADGTFRLDGAGGKVHIYATRFSTYAIGYTADDQNASDEDGSSSPAVYPIHVQDGTPNGTVSVSPKSAGRGAAVTVTATPDKGYAIGEVTVTDRDGKEIAVTAKGGGRYAFTMPGGTVTVRAVFVKITGGYENCPRDDTCPLWPYTDVSLEAWYHDGVHYCIENGLMSGYGGNLFGPDDDLSRAQFAQILFNRAGRPAVNYLMRYSDVEPGLWYTEAIRWASRFIP